MFWPLVPASFVHSFEPHGDVGLFSCPKVSPPAQVGLARNGQLSQTRNGDPMSDTTTTEPSETDPEVITPEPAATETETVVDWQAEAQKWKTFARKNEDEAKSLRPAAKKLAEIEDANRTELERVQAALDAATKTANEALEAKLRSDVAAAKGVPAGLLTGSTQEELEAAADALLAFKGKTPNAPTSEGQGKQGTQVGEGLAQISEAELAAMYAAGDEDGIVKAKSEGRLNNALGIRTI